MKVDSGIIKGIFTLKNLKEYMLVFLSIMATITIINMITTYNIYKTVLDNYIERLVIIDEFNGKDLNLFCNTVSCTAAYDIVTSKTYVNEKGILVEDKNDTGDFEATYLGIFNDKFDTVIKFNDYVLTTNDGTYINSLVNVIKINYIAIFFFFTIPFIVFKYLQLVVFAIRDKVAKEELELSLQINLAESINHELMLPVATLKTINEDYYKTLSVKVDCKTACGFKINKNLNMVDKLHTSAVLALETIEGVIQTISDSKELKYETKDTSVFDILKTVEASINTLNVKNIDVTIEKGLDLVKIYRPARELGNGGISRIFKNNIVNSKEAKADNVVIVANVVNNIMAVLFIDNGMGIRQRGGGIIKNPNNIFKNGFTTKSKNGDNASNVDEVSKTRGMGMFLNKEELRKVGGDITVISTSKKGTVFKIMFPVKKIGEKE